MNIEDAEHLVFSDCLVCELPLACQMVDMPLSHVAAYQAQASLQLQRVSLIEDGRVDDVGLDDASDARLDYIRLEAKVDMLMGLVAKLLNDPLLTAVARSVHWSHRGMRLSCPGRWVEGQSVLLRVSLRPLLPEVLELPAKVLAAATAGLEEPLLILAFAEGSEEFSEALQRHLFRLHRRSVSKARR